MNSLETREFITTLQNYIAEADISWEVKRIILTVILGDVTKNAEAEMLAQLKERSTDEQSI